MSVMVEKVVVPHTKEVSDIYHQPLTPLEKRVDALFQQIVQELAKGEAASSTILNALFMKFIRLLQQKAATMAKNEVWELTSDVRLKAVEKKNKTGTKLTLVLTLSAGALQLAGGFANFKPSNAVLKKLAEMGKGLASVGDAVGKGADISKWYEEKGRITIEVDLQLKQSQLSHVWQVLHDAFQRMNELNRTIREDLQQTHRAKTTAAGGQP